MGMTVAVIAPGMMGAGVGGRLSSKGARVITLLEGRSAPTLARAAAAKMEAASEAEVAAADIILSIVPPGEAVAIAKRLAPFLIASHRPVAAGVVSPGFEKSDIAIFRGWRYAIGAGTDGGPDSGTDAGPANTCDDDFRTGKNSTVGSDVYAKLLSCRDSIRRTLKIKSYPLYCFINQKRCFYTQKKYRP